MCLVATRTGDLATAEQAINRLVEIATTRNSSYWQTSGRLLEGRLLVTRGEFAKGVGVLFGAFDTCRAAGWRTAYSEFREDLAAGLAGLGRMDEALDVIDGAIAAAAEQDARQTAPEAFRIKGEILLGDGSAEQTAVAEKCFDNAAVLAREQGALFWELRVALSQARLQNTRGRGSEAGAALKAVYCRFTEGFDTADLRAAKALLERPPS
jgi:predicted ATPase